MAHSAEVSSTPKPVKALVGEANDTKSINPSAAPAVAKPGGKSKDAPKSSASALGERAATSANGLHQLRPRLVESRARLLEHVSTLILSLVLACIVWFTAISQENPIKTQTFEVPLEIRGVPAGLELLDEPSIKDITVTAKAPQLTLKGLTSSNFSAFVDFSGAELGMVERPITVQPPDSRIQIVPSQRDVLSAQLDLHVEREVPVEGRIMDGPAFGYEAETPLLTPISTTIRGPQTYVDEVTAAVVEIYLDKSNNQVERPDLSIQLRDAQGERVAGVQVDPALANVIVPIEELPGRKEVTVITKYAGEPARGYRVGGITARPATVVLIGDDQILENLPGSVETEDIDIYNATEDVRERVRLRLPPGVEAFEGSTVVATVNITPNIGGLKVSREPTIQNKAEGLVYSILLDRVDVFLSGPQPLLDSLEEEDVRVIIDVNGLIPGNHYITPDVQLADGLQLEDVLPETVQVSISEEITEGDSSTPSQ